MSAIQLREGVWSVGVLNPALRVFDIVMESRYGTSYNAYLVTGGEKTALIEAVHKNLDKMYRYVDLRKKLLGVDELHMYDVYTPIVADADQTIPYEQAKETVLEALQVLGEDYVDLLKEGFNNRWIDVYENVGKRSGAYSSGNSRPHPYVLLNHKDNLDCQFTLAHEMGHALHSYHSCKYQPVSTSDYVIFVAEVASTCNEVLLMRYLLAHTDDKRERAYLINHFLEQFRTTLYRQTMFAEFELNVGRMAQEGTSLTPEVLNAEYRRLNRLYFGENIVLDHEIDTEWMRIPHFYYNYYVFQYATGYAAAIALSRRILREGAPAVKDYIGFLSGGCSKSPIDLLKGAGVDMSTTKPAPSVIWEEVAAVTEPFSRKQGFSPASVSAVVPGRMPSSRQTTTSPPSGPGTVMGMICPSKQPPAWAWAARRWLSTAMASISARLMPHWRATFSAVMPMVVYTSGRCSASQGSASSAPTSMGTRDMDSTPPAMTTSSSPQRMALAAVAMVCRPEEQ